MTLKLPRATDPMQARHNQILENEDIRNRKMGSDLELGSERLILRSPDGTRYQVIVNNGGGVSVAPATPNGNAAAMAWTPFTATLTVDTGVISQVSNSSYKQVGKTVFFGISENLTIVSGTPTQIQLSLPIAPLRLFSVVGRIGPTRVAATARYISVAMSSILRKVDGTTYVPATTDVYEFTGTYEAA